MLPSPAILQESTEEDVWGINREMIIYIASRGKPDVRSRTTPDTDAK
jgi:hypothetical protein